MQTHSERFCQYSVFLCSTDTKIVTFKFNHQEAPLEHSFLCLGLHSRSSRLSLSYSGTNMIRFSGFIFKNLQFLRFYSIFCCNDANFSSVGLIKTYFIVNLKIIFRSISYFSQLFKTPQDQNIINQYWKSGNHCLEKTNLFITEKT